jgi:hypothetical protein
MLNDDEEVPDVSREIDLHLRGLMTRHCVLQEFNLFISCQSFLLMGNH